jgi:hypothetical protein
MQLELAKIRRDGGTQPRAKLSEETICEYADDMRNGDVFKPVTVFFDGQDYWLANGFHRVEAKRRLDPDGSMEAEVHQGTLADAQWHSFSVNKTHGLRRTNVDKARAIRAALQHPQGLGKSDAAIAEHVGVRRETVLKYRHLVDGAAGPAETGNKEASPRDLLKTNKSTIEMPQNECEVHATSPGIRLRDSTIVGNPKDAAPDHCDSAAPTNASPQTPDLLVSNKSTRRTGRDGRTIDTAKIGRSHHRHRQKPRSPAELAQARRDGYRGRLTSDVKLTLPNNHVYNCAFDLLRHFTFEYLQKVFEEIVNIHQQQSQKEAS